MTSLEREDGTEAPPEPATVLVDAEGNVAAVSRAAEVVLDRGAGDVRGLPLTELFPGLSADPPASGTVMPRRVSGVPTPVLYRLAPMAGSPYRLMLLTSPDAAKEAELGSALLHALLTQDRIGFVVRDTDLRVRAANTVASMPLLPVASSLRSVMSREDAATAEATLREVLNTGVPVVAREHHVHSLSPPLCEWSLSVSVVRLEDGKGDPTGVAVLLTDGTEQWLAGQRLRLRHTAAVTIGHSLDIRQTATEIADLLVPDFGALVSVDLAEAVLDGDEPPRSFGGGDLHLRRTAARSSTGAWPAALLAPDAAVPPLPDTPGIRQLQEGRTVVVERAALERALADPSLIALVVPDKGHSVAVAPMAARGRVLGVIAVWRTEPAAPFTAQDAELLSEIAAHAALSVDNARRYTREHRAAVALQRRLLPWGPLRTTAVETAGTYQPAGSGADIGGDWFDAIPLPSLRVAMVVGDVIGHGLHASATMGRLRTAVQTLADLELPPDETLTRLDDLVTRLAGEAEPEHRDVVGGTCLFALYDPVTEQCSFASAGHPPPIVVTPEGKARTVHLRPGPPLGTGGLPFETTTVRLEPGSMLALFTDGLLDDGEADVDAALRNLAERLSVCQTSRQPLQEAARSLVSARPAAGDDTALLLARNTPLDPDDIAQWSFPADLSAVADARAAVLERLAAWGLDDLAFTTELIVSELVTNAMRYAGGPVGLRLIRDTVLICEVSDPSSTQPRLRRARTTDEGGRGLFLVAQLSLRWGSRYTATGKTIWVEQEFPD
jgi:serine phosphatase RsbU (regulator of sigma subunit)/anti-sigma regulatory factor (Ser/Thr protein kinase)